MRLFNVCGCSSLPFSHFVNGLSRLNALSILQCRSLKKRDMRAIWQIGITDVEFFFLKGFLFSIQLGAPNHHVDLARTPKHTTCACDPLKMSLWRASFSTIPRLINGNFLYGLKNSSDG